MALVFSSSEAIILWLFGLLGNLCNESLDRTLSFNLVVEDLGLVVDDLGLEVTTRLAYGLYFPISE